MLQSAQLSETKQALLEKYLGGKLTQKTEVSDAIARRAPGSLAPLSFGQQQMWLLAQLIATTPVYNESVTVRLPGALNVCALEQSFNEFIARHEVWRTSFPVVDGQPVQMVHPTLRFDLPVVDLCDLPENEREPEAIRLATEQAVPSFDLAKLPLLRPMLIRLGEEDHRLYLTIHHILFDGTIYEVFLPELSTLYEAFSQGKSSPLLPLDIQYADFASWQREWLQGTMLSEQVDYWKQRLANAPVMLELPTDRPRPLVQTHRGARFPFHLSKNLANALKALSQREGVTLYMVLVAAFQTLLHRYTGQNDILIGTTTGGRQCQQVQQLIGVFLNTLVLRTDMAGNPAFRELLGRVCEVVLEAQAHQDVPFEYLVKELQPERNAGWNPFIQVVLSLEPPLPSVPTGWTITQSDVEAKAAKFDLYLELDDRADGFAAWLEYNTDLFDGVTIQRMVGHWQTILESVVLDPTQRLAEMPLLTQAEQALMLSQWNNTIVGYPQDQCVHQLFEAQVERTPDAVVVVCENEHMTYRELNCKANQFARYLQRQGVRPETLVGICMERSLDMMVALLGVLKAGGAYVPLDPTYPRERLAYMVQDSQARLLVTQQRLVKNLPQGKSYVVCLDTAWASIAQEETHNLECDVPAANRMYVIYTSGSTGRPKGVQILHSAVVNFLLSMQHTIGVTSKDVVLAVTTFSFDIAALELFLPLISGAKLLLERREVTSDGVRLLEKLTAAQPTLMQATPATWRMLLEAGLSKVHQLRILCGGEALSRELLGQLVAREPLAIWNLYGPTETTIWSTACEVSSATEPITIGKPIANTQIYLLDAHQQPVPIGVPGEIYIGGAGLARGYLNQASITAEKFVAHPLSNDRGARLYRTGDLAQYLPDGNIEYLGRADSQVKIHGFRIELGEIEAILRQLPQVREAVVVAREDTAGDKRLVAYVVVAQKESLTLSDMRNALKEYLPEYMLPSSFVLLDVLPLTPNGKIDRRALRAPDSVASMAEETFIEPTRLLHYQLISLWEELLNRQPGQCGNLTPTRGATTFASDAHEQAACSATPCGWQAGGDQETRPVGIRDNFFLLGGHSLLATRLLARIEQGFGKKIALSTLFAGPTIEQLADALCKQGMQEESNTRPTMVAVQSNVVPPLVDGKLTGGGLVGGRKHRPFFFLHGDYLGGPFYCYPLARGLGAEQPFYALEPYTFNKHEAPPTLEAIAASHIPLLRSIQPEGPYLLGGFCNGGLVAYEMARQLQAQGESVDMLALVNPHPVGYLRWVRRIINACSRFTRFSEEQQLYCFLWPRHLYRYVQHVYRYMRFPHYRRSLTMQRANAGEGTILALKELHEQMLRDRVRRGDEQQMAPEQSENDESVPAIRLDALLPESLFPAGKALRQDYLGMFYWAAADYEPGFYAGKSTLLFSQDHQESGLELQWCHEAEAKNKALEVYGIAGTHDTCKTKHLRDMAMRLRMCLNRV